MKEKYRIIESGGKFHPQYKKCLFWLPVRTYSAREVHASNLKIAQKAIDNRISALDWIEKPSRKRIVYEYNPVAS